jgi:hypothetical protein
MADNKTRVDIGFQGGGMVTARLTDADFEKLTKGLDQGEGWHTVTADDGEISLRLDRVVYVRREAAEQRVGF